MLEVAADDGARERFAALAERHQLPPATGEVLERYVRLLDWTGGNFLPLTAPELPEPNMALTDAELHDALKMCGEALSALDLEPVRSARRMADVGSGTGFPGLVLTIALPETQVTLIEIDAEKVGFLRALGAALGLENLEVVDSPLQDWSDGIGQCDLVTSRRVWRQNTILERVAPLLAPGGVTVRFGGRNEEKEKLAQEAAEANGLKLEAVHSASTETRDGRVRTGKRYLHMYRKVA